MKRTLSIGIIVAGLLLPFGSIARPAQVPEAPEEESQAEELRRLRDAVAAQQKYIAALEAELAKVREENRALNQRIEQLEAERKK